MGYDNKIITCANCGLTIDEPQDAKYEQQKPCINCGDVKRVVKVLLSGKTNSHSMLKGKKRKDTSRKILLEFQVGDDLCKESGKFMQKERYIDRENNKYKETVIDPTTKKLIHKSEHALTEHTGHGSAKYKKKHIT